MSSAYSEIDSLVQGALLRTGHFRTACPAGSSAWRALVRATLQAIEANRERLFSTIEQETGRIECDFEAELAAVRALLGAFDEIPAPGPGLEARGVAAVVGSSVWPVLHSVQFALLNLGAGNPVILKPAEKVTRTVQALVGLLANAHPLWNDVRVLPGDRETGRRLVCHEGVSVVVFQGSFEAGMRVRQDTLSQPAKEVLLFLGAKNPVILLDEPGEAVLDAILRDAFVGAGQNCLSASQVWVQGAFFERFVADFHEKSKAFRIGSAGSGALMGPLLDAAISDRYFKFIGISEREGAEIVMRGKPLSSSGGGNLVTPTLAVFSSMTPDQMRRSVSLQTEILAPHLSIIRFDRDEELSGALSRLSYGHSAAIYGDSSHARALAEGLSFGRVLVNQELLRSDPSVSAQVCKRSGNHAMLGTGLLGQLMRSRFVG